MFSRIQVGCYMVIGVLLIAVAMALSIDGNVSGSVVVMVLAVVMFVIATIQENMLD